MRTSSWPGGLPTSPQTVKIEMHQNLIRVWVDGDEKPLIAVADPEPIAQPGFVGVRAWGAAVSLDALTLTSGTKNWDALDAAAKASNPASQRALESLCLALLNLNELVYVD